ncbi:MAG: CpsD/CapB family tyrosine-protein kinase [Richelia sp.]|nr:CpsD/CapB family tyrosine-protein kinase [Richelia sp.]
MTAIDNSDRYLGENNDFCQFPQFLESFRLLHTNIQLLSSYHPMRSFVMTSAMPGDGKSTISFYLEQIAAAMGKKVLLVDTDLRQPNIHNISLVKNIWGLINLISSNTPHKQQLIQQMPSRNFSIMTAGQRLPDPTKLLTSEKMRGLMKEFEHDYDLVIYDTLPIFGLADASLLTPNTDGIVLVTRMEKTDREAIQQTIDNLRMSRANIFGMLINDHNNSFNDYYSKYYYH